MRMMFCHLTGSLRGRTQYFNTDSISFGVGEHCGIVFDSVQDAAVCPVHAELTVEDHTPTIRDRSGGKALLVNGERHMESVLHDGDLLQFGEGGPVVRFRLLSNGNGETKSWRDIVTDCRDIVVRRPHPRYLSALYLLRHLLTDVARYGSRAARIVAVLSLLAPVLVIAALGIVVYRQHLAAGESERRVAELVSQIEAGRLTRTELSQRIEQERLTLMEMRRQHEALMAELAASLKQQAPRAELQAIRRQLNALENAQRFAEEVVDRYGRGVGLLQGWYGLLEKGTGRPLRYQGFDQLGHPYIDREGNPLVTVEGLGPPINIYYAGTAFLLDKAGTILTNRHLVRMWEHYEPARRAMEAGFEPSLQSLRIFFPGDPEPIELELLGVSEQSDLAVLRAKRLPPGPVPLGLAPAGADPRIGEPVVVLSYPGTFDSLMGRLAKPVTDEILEEAGGEPSTLAEALARRKLIRPLATQGHIADLSPDRLTFEAGSAVGSSGGPVLDRAGRVIAINHAALRKVGGLNVGLRSGQARQMLAQLHLLPDPAAGASVRH